MLPPRPPRSALPLGGALARLGLFASLLGTIACAPSSLSARMEQARIDFSRDHYCPLDRVMGVAADTIAPPPSPAIAEDPARLAMWHAAAIKRAGPRRLVAVRGCGEQELYACWTLGGYEPARRGRRYVTIGAACLAQGERGGPE